MDKRILIAEDDPISRQLVVTRLTRWGYETLQAVDGAQAWELLQQPGAPRLAVLDWMMPEFSGVDLCRKVRSEKQQVYTYLLLLTAKDRKEDLIDGLEAGADDYLIKPVNALELKARLCVGERILTWQDQLMAARESLRFQATHDALSGIWNRGAILGQLEAEYARLQREPGFLGVIMIDLDHFKAINDTHGHEGGDIVLKTVAKRMLLEMRPYDRLGRYGGEEFLVFAPGCGLEQTVAVAERLLQALRVSEMALPTGSLRVTASMGVSAYAGEIGVSVEGLLRGADAALYRAKKRGRDRVERSCFEETRGRPASPNAALT